MKSKYNLTVMIVLLGLILFPSNLVKGQSCDNLISLWRLEEKTGNTYTDLIGGHNAMAYTSAPSQDVGKIGKAQSFNGTSSFITVSDHPDFDWAGDQSFTLEMWVKMKSISADDNMIFMGRDANAGSIHWWIGAAKNTGQSMFTLINSAGVSNISVGPNLAIGTWYHIVAVRDAVAKTNRFYVNNIQVDIDVVDYSGGNFDTDATIDMGVLNFNGNYDRFFSPIVMDEVAIYNTALTSGDIDAHFDNGVFGIGYCEDYAPYFLSEPDSLAVAGETFTYEAFATGLPTLQYQLVEGPGSINSSTGVFTWTPASVAASGTNFTISATNSQGTAFQSFYTYVAESPSCPSGIQNLWKLDETSGAPYDDFKGGNDADALVAPISTAGKFNGALQFDGSSRGINAPDDGTYNFAKASSFSFEFWMKTGTKGAYEVCMGRQGTIGDSDTSELHMWIGIDKFSGQALFALKDAHGNEPAEGHISGGPDLTDNAWHYVVAVRDGVTRMNYIYVDGSVVAESAVPFTYSNTFGTHDGDPFNIGYLSRANGTPAYFFSGALDEVAIYSKALSASEVSNNYLSSFIGDWHCQPGNYAPVFTTEPVQTALEDAVYTYNITTNDIDESDVLILSAPLVPDWLTFTDLGNGKGTLNGTPVDSDIGPHPVTLTVTDSKTSINQSFTLTVDNQNDPAVFTSSPVTSVDEDSPYTYTVEATDPDVDDVLTYSAITIPSWLSFNPVTHELLGTPTNDDVGDHPVEIEVTDGIFPVPQEFTITVVNVNDVPRITDQGVISTDEDIPFTITLTDLTVLDDDNDAVDFSLSVEAGINYTVDGGSIVPAENFNGMLIANLRVNDLEGSSEVFGAEVTVIPVNDAPVITSEPNKNAVVGSLYGYLMTATDPDGDDIIMAPISLPGFLSFDASTGVLGGTPGDGDIKDHIVALKVSDGKEETPLSYTLTVTKWPVGIEENTGAILNVYPIPADNHLIFELNLSEDGVISVYDLTGKQWIEKRISVRDDQVELDVSELGQGLYMYKVQTGDQVSVKSFVINR
ncbi:MAG: T9SS type A sorting domain-containing protein [Bacteroidetes bacterium]|nr:T9SS type A sorting domain-containing protein [Bacteroidota bacterium]